MINHDTTFVYFIRPVGCDGPVKIGCTLGPLGRLNDLMYWSPVDLEIVATLPGDRKLESRFQGLFADSHRRHEWFDATPELLAMIASIQDGTFADDHLPVGGSLPNRRRAPASDPRIMENRRVRETVRARFANEAHWPSDVRRANNALSSAHGPYRDDIIRFLLERAA